MLDIDKIEAENENEGLNRQVGTDNPPE